MTTKEVLVPIEDLKKMTSDEIATFLRENPNSEIQGNTVGVDRMITTKQKRKKCRTCKYFTYHSSGRGECSKRADIWLANGNRCKEGKDK